MMRVLFVFAVSMCVLLGPARAQQGDCPPAGYDRARLEALRAAGWEIANPRERRAFAQGLVACVASPDPFLRDAVAFEALSHLLRTRQLDVATQTSLVNDLLPRLASEDPNGFEAPFAALALSEVVRAERLNSHFDDYMREEVTARAIAYMNSVRDYRGFDQNHGWRHGVAHGADLMVQLVVNDSTGRDDLVRIRDAIAVHLAPEGHFYVYGEPERLMRPILFMARRGVFDENAWSAWFAAVAAPHENAFATQEGLAWRHNMMAFLSAVHLNARLSEDESDDVLLAGVEAALRAMP